MFAASFSENCSVGEISRKRKTQIFGDRGFFFWWLLLFFLPSEAPLNTVISVATLLLILLIEDKLLLQGCAVVWGSGQSWVVMDMQSVSVQRMAQAMPLDENLKVMEFPFFCFFVFVSNSSLSLNVINVSD